MGRDSAPLSMKVSKIDLSYGDRIVTPVMTYKNKIVVK